MRFLRRSLTGLFLLSVTVAILVWAGATLVGAIQERMARDGGVRPEGERVFAANVVAVEPTRIAPETTVFGEVRSRRTLEVRATASGRVVELSPGFAEGGAVKAGELLVAIDPADAEAAVAVARTDLDEAKATLAESERAVTLAADDLASAEAQQALRERALSRARDLAQRGVGSAAAVETAELAMAQAAQAVLSRRQAVAQADARLDQARIAVSRRQIGLAEAERALADTRIVAQFAGTLSDVSAVEGGLVAPNERLASLIDAEALEVAFRLSTSQYARLVDEGGQLFPAAVTAVLDVLGADLVATGRITRESGSVAQGQTGRLIFAALDDAAGYRPGDFVTVRVTEPALDGVALLPATALDGSGTVLALLPDDRLEVVPITLMRRQGDAVIVSAEGIAGREVVAERSPLLGAGVRVRPLRAGAAPATDEQVDLIELAPERRAALIAFVESNARMPAEAKARVLAQLSAERVPAQVVERIESRMGG